MKLPSGELVYNSTPIYPGSNFTWGEATKNCTRHIQDLIIDGILIKTALQIEATIDLTARSLDEVREQLGSRPIHVNSWYRPSHLNLPSLKAKDSHIDSRLDTSVPARTPSLGCLI